MGRTRGFQDGIGSECPALRMSPGLPKVFCVLLSKGVGAICPPTKDFLRQPPPAPPPPPIVVIDNLSALLHCMPSRNATLPSEAVRHVFVKISWPLPRSSASPSVSLELVGIACASPGASALRVSWEHPGAVMGRTRCFQDSIGSECPLFAHEPRFTEGVCVFAFDRRAGRSAFQRRIFCVKPPPAPPPPPAVRTQPFCIAALHAIAQHDVAFQSGAPCIC
jgi:hypothetical protein